jgi:hypothetical protein
MASSPRWGTFNLAWTAQTAPIALRIVYEFIVSSSAIQGHVTHHTVLGS